MDGVGNVVIEGILFVLFEQDIGCFVLKQVDYVFFIVVYGYYW